MSIKSFFGKVEDFFEGAGVTVSKDFEELVGKQAAEAFGHDALIVLKSALGKIVTQVVADVEAAMPGATGEQKHAAASSKIGEVAKAAGIAAASSIVNLLIEVAVAALKAKFAPAA